MTVDRTFTTPRLTRDRLRRRPVATEGELKVREYLNPELVSDINDWLTVSARSA
jgi:hypothetical protein